MCGVCGWGVWGVCGWVGCMGVGCVGGWVGCMCGVCGWGVYDGDEDEYNRLTKPAVAGVLVTVHQGLKSGALVQMPAVQ